MIWDREKYIAHCQFQFTGDEMFTEIFGLLVGLDKEWASQGATKEEIELSAFGWDSVLEADIPANCGAITGIEPKIIEDNEAYRIAIDGMGRKTKLFKQNATLQLPLDYPVKNADDWLKVKHWYEFSESRVNRDGLKDIKKLRDQGCLIRACIPGGFDEPRQLMGEEGLCVACYEQPEMIEDMLQTITDTCIKVFERVADTVTIDMLETHDDMAGKSGPLFGPAQVDRFMKPYYRRVWDLLSGAGCSIFSQDSDGDINPIIDSLLDCGLNFLYPCEPGSGMDIVEIRKKYGSRVTLFGGINKYALRGSKEDIRKELEYKICGVTKGGGTIFALDHRIPNGTPIENYRYYVNLGREMLGRAPLCLPE